MKRIVTTALALSLLTLAAPGIASAHNGRRHHRAHHAGTHARHARHTHVIAIGATGSSGATSGSSGAPATPTSNESAGTVASYTNGVLTITLNDGTTTVSGQVTEGTEIGCRPATPPPTTGGDQDADDQGGTGGGDQGAGAPQGGDQQSGHDQNQGREDDNEEGCTTAALVKGAIVRRAELKLSSFGAVWEKVDLIQ
jgi:hypothetical protein